MEPATDHRPQGACVRADKLALQSSQAAIFPSPRTDQADAIGGRFKEGGQFSICLVSCNAHPTRERFAFQTPCDQARLTAGEASVNIMPTYRPDVRREQRRPRSWPPSGTIPNHRYLSGLDCPTLSFAPLPTRSSNKTTANEKSPRLIPTAARK